MERILAEARVVGQIGAAEGPMPFEPIPGDFALGAVPAGTGEMILSGAIARSTSDGRVTYLTCGLAECLIDGHQYFEFYFQIDVISLDGDHEDFSTQEREMACAYIPAEIRSKVLDLMVTGLGQLLTTVNPERVYFVTKGQNLPDKALSKFGLICQACENTGYFTHEEGADPLGRRYWKMAKMPIEPHIGVA